MKLFRSIEKFLSKKWLSYIPLKSDKLKYQIQKLIYFLRTSDASYFFIFSILVGSGGGFGAIVFRWLILQFKNLFFTKGGEFLSFMDSYYVIIIPVLGGLVVGPMIYFLAREAKGHGVPEVMKSVLVDSGKIRPRVAIVKALASSICIGSGGSVGREGPIIQIGSAIGSSIGQILKLTEEKTKTLVACGAAAGIAATFNSPLGGIFFALEIILREYGLRNFSSVVLSSITATIISRHFLGNQPAFQVPPFELYGVTDILYYLVFGLITAFFAWLFIQVLYKSEDLFNSIKIPEYLKPAIGGLFIGIIGLFFPQIFGVGYETIEASIHGRLVLWVIIALVFLKIIATSITLGSGGSGGVFAPSLFIGALLGEAFGLVAHKIIPGTIIPPGAFALVGMASVFAGTSQAPISSILLLFEMTGNYKILPPLMITCVLSTLLVRWKTKYSIYTLKLVRKGINVDRQQNEDLMESITVSEAMLSDVISVSPSDSIKKVGLLIKSTNHRGFPVLKNDKLLAGIVTRIDINKALAKGNSEAEIGTIMSKNIVVCYPDESLKTALHKMASKNIGRIPVVERKNEEHLIGILTRKSLISSYNKALELRKIYSGNTGLVK
jgi:CIC family chloride channel protein